MNKYTLLDGMELYENSLTDRLALSNFRTSLIRYTLPILGFVLSSSSVKRLHQKDIEYAKQFLSSIELSDDLSNNLKKAQNNLLDAMSLSFANKRHQRQNLSKFIQFLVDKNLLNNLENKDHPKPKRIRNLTVDLGLYEKNKIKDSLRYAKNKLILSLRPEDYLDDYPSNQTELRRIEKELNELYEFELKEKRKVSADQTIEYLKRIYGWQYKTHKDLTQISFKNFIKVINSPIDISSFKSIDEYFIAKGKAEYLAKQEAKRLIKFLNKFFADYNINGASSRNQYIGCLISLAKYLHQEVTDFEMAEDYNDIPVIRTLRVFRRKSKKETKKITPDVITWEIVMKALYEIKDRADRTHYEERSRTSGNIIKRKIGDERRAKLLQDFLILGFLTLVPPCRVRIIRDLRIGETLKHGVFEKGIFIDISKLEDKSAAKYYIHLQPEDYKTGSYYGEWLGEFPNFQFPDGKTFYSYLDKYIYSGFRDALVKDSQYLFVAPRKLSPFTTKDISIKIQQLFLSSTNYKISPHKLRTIFRTYLTNQKATSDELKSAAFWMRHSNKMAVTTYTQQTLSEKLAPGLEAIITINKNLLDRSTQQHNNQTS